MQEEERTERTAAIPEAPAERVRAILESVVEGLGLEATVEVSEDEDEIRGTVEGDELGLLIGRHGQTIDAVQLICYRAAFQGQQERKRVSVDAAGYRLQRAELLHREADRAADHATKVKRPIRLEPMSATERKVVHDRLAERAGIETYSEGEEPERCVVVAPLLSSSDSD